MTARDGRTSTACRSSWSRSAPRCRCSARGARRAHLHVRAHALDEERRERAPRAATTTARAIVEFVLLAVVLLVPFVYAVLCVFEVAARGVRV